MTNTDQCVNCGRITCFYCFVHFHNLSLDNDEFYLGVNGSNEQTRAVTSFSFEPLNETLVDINGDKKYPKKDFSW
jgi:hypothetical protein